MPYFWFTTFFYVSLSAKLINIEIFSTLKDGTNILEPMIIVDGHYVLDEK
jgi:hypothetical protein